jgi:group I intron endonuclease
MTCGIYVIEHSESGRRYVGSSNDIERRWRYHRSRLGHGIADSSYLQRAWAKHGAAAFSFKKLLICSEENLLMYEQRCIDGYRAAEGAFGFNMAAIARAGFGGRHSAETRAKMSRSHTGVKRPPEIGEQVRQRMTGRIVSKETKDKIRAKRALQTNHRNQHSPKILGISPLSAQ